MSNERIRLSAEILEKTLRRYGFEVSGEAMMDESNAMASVTHRDGISGDYVITIIKDHDEGRCKSSTEVFLSVKLRNGGESEELFPYENCGTNMPLKTTMIDLMQTHIEPGLKKYLGVR